jgi:hypothetical protein
VTLSSSSYGAYFLRRRYTRFFLLFLLFLPSPHITYIYLSIRAQLLAPALVRRRVLRSVPLVTVRRHLALATRDIYICSSLAPRVVADTSQLFAKALVLGHVPHGVVLAAIYRHSAAGTLLESFAELQVRGACLARQIVTSPGLLLFNLGVFVEIVGKFLSCEYDTVDKMT